MSGACANEKRRGAAVRMRGLVQVKYNKILLSRAYVDMANRMKNISALASGLLRYEKSKKTIVGMLDDSSGVKKVKKSVAELLAQKRVLRAMRYDDAAVKLGDILQLTVVEAVNLDMLDRFTKVDASCVAVLTDKDGSPFMPCARALRGGLHSGGTACCMLLSQGWDRGCRGSKP